MYYGLKVYIYKQHSTTRLKSHDLLLFEMSVQSPINIQNKLLLNCKSITLNYDFLKSYLFQILFHL